MGKIALAAAILLFLLLGCAGEKPDVYSGWYISADKGMRISKSGSDAYVVLIVSGFNCVFLDRVPATP